LPGDKQVAGTESNKQGDLDYPHAAAWPAHVRELLLSGTRLGALASRANALIRSRCESYLPTLLRARPGLFQRFGTAKSDSTSRNNAENHANGTVEANTATELEAQLADLRSEVLWAWGMYESRHFPAGLCPTDDTEEDDEEEEDEMCKWGQNGDEDDEEKRRRRRPGILLPFLDLLNHHPAARVSWTGDASNVKFWYLSTELTSTNIKTVARAATSTEGEPVVATPPSTATSPHWVELFNNYGGSKGAEELLLDFGFAESEALKRDTVPLWLLSPGFTNTGAKVVPAGASIAIRDEEEKNETAERSAGPFELRRFDRRERWEQFPDELWPALERAAGKSSSSSSGNSRRSSSAGAVGFKRPADAITEELPANAEALAILVSSLSSALAPFNATSGRDARASRGLAAAPHDWPTGFSHEVSDAPPGQRTCGPAVRAACAYRLSQRRVLSEALQTATSYLEKMVGEAHAEARDQALKVAAKEGALLTPNGSSGAKGSAPSKDSPSDDDSDEESNGGAEEEEDDDYGALAASVGAGQRGRYTIMMLGDVMVEVQAAE